MRIVGSYIADHREILSQRHYIRKAGTQEYWFDFASNKLKNYQQQFGFAFRMVLYGSETEDDAYVMPYSEVASFLTDDALDHRGRWIGNIRNNVLRLNSRKSMSVSAYYNAFDLLDISETQATSYVVETDVSYHVQDNDDVDWAGIQKKVYLFNEQYENIVPHKRRVISEQVARPNIVTDYLKQLRDYVCQLCGEQGFMQRNGTRYIEAHHITELHRLIPGSYCSDNIVIVCATCHRKLHYADVRYESLDAKHIRVSINGVTWQFERNIVSVEPGAQ
jgi:5-methylcytosine-specific restriction endonuclease McrA